MLVWLRGQNVILGIFGSKCVFGKVWGQSVILESFGGVFAIYVKCGLVGFWFWACLDVRF
jgi:hypothetical protein